MAALAVTFLAVPQGIAYALIAGLPPVAGLYAATVPTIAATVFRSSRLVVTGPTNAVSLLVGGAVAAQSLASGASPSLVAVQLALLVGVFQIVAGGLRLGSLVDFISKPVVLGYISGAGVLIAVGQLPNLTATPGGGADLAERLMLWGQGLDDAHALSVGLGLSVAAAVAALRRIDPRVPATLLALGGATAAHIALGLPGVVELGDLAAVPLGLPLFTPPSLPGASLISLAAAVTVLSLVESTAVARSLAEKTGQRLDASLEFIGVGVANLSASLVGGYPVSGSLARSKLNHRAGARSRLSSVFGGLFVLAVLMVAGPLVERVPVSAFAGLLLVVGWDLVDRKRIRLVMRSTLGDKAAFLVTLAGTWLLPLDQAIYLGVAISIALFVRRASLLIVRELRVDASGRLHEVDEDGGRSCPEVRVLHVEGALFFGSAAELRRALDDASQSEARAVVVRLKRTQGIDMTCLDVLTDAAESLRARGKVLILVGMRPSTMERLERGGVAKAVGGENLFPTREGWFAAMDEAIRRALDFTGTHAPDCALERYLETRPSNSDV